MRVYELAKEYDIKATEFVDVVKGFGINISSHLSGLDDAQISDIRHKMSIQNEIKDPEVNQWASSPLPPDEGHSCHHTEEVAVIREEIVIEDIAPSEPDEEVVVDEVVETYIGKEEQTIEPTDNIPPEVKEWLISDSEQLEGVVEDVAESLTQEVVVEPPRGFFGWLRSLFS